MLANYFRIAFRNFRNHKLFSLINIGGLAIGISAALVIYLIVQHELSYEKFHKDGERIYRMTSQIDFPDMEIKNSGVPYPTAKAVRQEMTGLDVVSHFNRADDMKVSVPIPGNQSPAAFLHQKDIVYADEYFFQLFPRKWLAGSPVSSLKDPFQVVLSESRAKTYFASLEPKDIIGRQIYYSDTIKVLVSGIVEDLNEVTHFTFKEFISIPTIEVTALKNQWGVEEWSSITSSSQLFVKLSKGTTPDQVLRQVPGLRSKYRKPEPGEKDGDQVKHALQPLSDIHFNGDFDVFGQRIGHRPTLYGLLAVAAFLLLLGCINFVNLTTAQSTQRAKEIGIRKTMGSRKKQLIFQFLTETLLLTLVTTVLSVLLTPWLLNIFKDFIPEGITFRSLNQPHVWLFLASLILAVTLFAGFYPALVLTKFNPILVLKNQAHSNSAQTRKAWLRKTLTVTQFVIAQFLVIATLVVSKQVNYSINKDLGYKREAIVTMNTRWDFYSDKKDNRRFVLLEKVKAIPGIESVSLGSSAPASGSINTNVMKLDNGKKITETMVEIKIADTNYFGLYGLKLVAGRNLQVSDTIREYIMNETYARFAGFENPADAVGKFIDNDNKKIPIVGIVRDFHTKSTHETIKPLVYAAATSRSYVIHMALKPKTNVSDWKQTLARVEKAYKEIYPEDEFNPVFFDESIAAFYKTEQNVARLLRWSSGLCIFISCLGLLGLAIFITNSRTKEIGVRKVLGASVVQIVSLLSRDFIALVLVAFMITLPIAWWVMNNWLRDFAYRTGLSWWIFAITGGGMIVVAMIILGFRTLRSALENPVKSLRTE